MGAQLPRRHAAATAVGWQGGQPGDDLSERLSESLLERAIGVIYRPETELMSHYFECVLAAYAWFEQTHAVSPLPAASAKGVPATYPFGI